MNDAVKKFYRRFKGPFGTQRDSVDKGSAIVEVIDANQEPVISLRIAQSSQQEIVPIFKVIATLLNLYPLVERLVDSAENVVTDAHLHGWADNLFIQDLQKAILALNALKEAQDV